MATTTNDVLVRAKTRLSAIARALERNDARRQELFAERLALVETLAAGGVQHAELARLAKTTRYNIRFMLFEERKRRSSNGVDAEHG